MAEIVAEMDYLRTREQKLRDTNESTNTRVKWFAFGTMGMLVALGAWQVVYLRAYFRHVLFNSCGHVKLISGQIKASYLNVHFRVQRWHGVQGETFKACLTSELKRLRVL